MSNTLDITAIYFPHIFFNRNPYFLKTCMPETENFVSLGLLKYSKSNRPKFCETVKDSNTLLKYFKTQYIDGGKITVSKTESLSHCDLWRESCDLTGESKQ